MVLHTGQYTRILKKKIFEKKNFFSVVGKNLYIRAEISAHQKKSENAKLRLKDHPRS